MAALYHFTGFAEVAVKVTVPEPQRSADVVTGTGGIGFIVATAGIRLPIQPLSTNA